MKSYFALVDKDPDSAFGIRFPDIPGCFSAADAAEESEAIPDWCGKIIPFTQTIGFV